MILPATIRQLAPGERNLQGLKYMDGRPLSYRVLKRFKEVVMPYGLYSPSVRQILNNWATQNCIIPKDCRKLMSAIVEYAPHRQWLTWWKDEASVMEQQNPD